MNSKNARLEVVAFVLIALMTLLQGFYGIFAYVDPESFAILRGTELVAEGDLDWVRIYASRTMFVALIIGFLLYKKDYKLLMWAALFGIVMPITDGLLAYEAQAATKVIVKHAATVVYLLVISMVMKALVAKDGRPK